ncbi:MAG: hypothetical protein LBJ21_04530 [Acidobacteriota bacterium]|nr:hypothetical protein [Acidobacteriota bacterium]
MVPNFSIPLNGLQQAGWDLEKIANRIASQGQGARSEEGSGAAAVGLDPAADMTMLAQVENTAKANLRVLSTHDDLSKSILNLFA